MFKNLLAGAGVAALALNSVPAAAQLAPGATSSAPRVYTPTPDHAATPSTTLPNSVLLSDFIRDGEVPRAVRRDTLARDTPVYPREKFLREYKPPRDEHGNLRGPAPDILYRSIALANLDLCDEAKEFMSILLQLDQEYASAEEEYAIMGEIYAGLPKDIKRATAVMTIAQAGQAGALCLLTGGLYCIAAVAGGVGNIFGVHANKKLSLANIRLSLANIRLSMTNIRHGRLTVRLDAFWLDMAIPYCEQVFPGAGVSQQGSYSSAFTPLQASPRVTYERNPRARPENPQDMLPPQYRDPGY